MSNTDKKTPEELAKGVQAAIDAARAAAATKAGENSEAAKTAQVTDDDVVKAAAAAGITSEHLENLISEILEKRKKDVVQKLTPKEPDYKNLNEADIYAGDVYIPVIEHELPDYMNIQLKDSEFVPVWANKDQRRLGALLAEGYELLKAEHFAPSFKIPLRFTSEGTYEYQDVIALRVHKRIRFAKLKRIQEISQNQLKPARAQQNAKAKLVEDVIANDPALDSMFGSGKFAFYDTATK